jgi:hypothetical protein
MQYKMPPQLTDHRIWIPYSFNLQLGGSFCHGVEQLDQGRKKIGLIILVLSLPLVCPRQCYIEGQGLFGKKT